MADDDDLPADLGSITPAYRRALWIVVGLNVAYGAAEVAGSVLAASDALRADALDFVGDGSITLVALVAARWGAVTRAKSALVQGLFLGLLGVGVLCGTVYRVFVEGTPESTLMLAFGAAALVVNVAAALILRPHRRGDASAHAVWLFSRNDALGNLAVLAAGGLVAWTGQAWPDLVVAVLVAMLFLHSAWSIVKDARAELAEARDAASAG
jgi:cation diffusion facilitator family transporter